VKEGGKGWEKRTRKRGRGEGEADKGTRTRGRDEKDDEEEATKRKTRQATQAVLEPTTQSENGRSILRRIVLRGFALATAIAFVPTMVARPVSVATDKRRARRADGSVIHWSIDRQHVAPRQGILVLAQGSGCLGTGTNPNLKRAKRLLPEFAVVMVEKYGVRPSDVPKDPFGGCSRTFYKHNTVSRRVEDLQRVLGELEAAPWWDQRLVLFGGSEGGAVVSMLAPRVTPTAVVIFSAAPGRSFRESLKLVLPPQVAAQADSEFTRIKAHPLSSKLWGGNSYRWWADIMDHDLTADVLSVRAPILLIQGERDRSAPVQDARMVRDDFQRAGHSNLTYWEFAGYDHQMHDATGASHLDEVMQRIAAWLAGTVSTASTVDDSAPPTFPRQQ